MEDSLTTLSHKEQSSFIAAYYSNERRTMLEKGDIMPALLLHPNQTKAILFWEKHDGTYAIIMMDTRINENGKDEWYISRSQEINKP
ncbi:hypothetical protein QP794_14935 [Paenibacillus sp. UMB7766-LJ446]|nr:hypothetical protein [Paenibacillus sp. UMB7766-LJ446]